MAAKVGFIGVGQMGHGMGTNLMAAGYDLIVMAHRARELVDDLIDKGASECLSPAAIAEASDIVILCVTGSPAVEETVFGDHGLISGLSEGMLVIDCSTGEPDVVEKVAAAMAERGVDFADAPLARTPVEAAAGKLNTMVGAGDSVFERAKPVLETFCENIFHMGGPGTGTRMKLINNLITMGQAALIAEAMSACKATGVDLRRFSNVISAGGGNSGIFQMIVPAILDDGSFKGMKFSLANAAKDLGYYESMAEQAGIEHPLGGDVYKALAVAHQSSGPDGLVGDLVAAMAARNQLKIGKL